MQAISARPIYSPRRVDELKGLKGEARKSFGLSVPKVAPLLKTGSDKPSLTAAYELLQQEVGTQRAHQLEDACPQCSCTSKSKQSLADRKRHYQACQAKAMLACMEEKTFLSMQKRGCPWSGCKTKWAAKHSRQAVEKHIYQCHPTQRAVCGFETDDGNVCQFSGGNEDIDSMDTALLTIHREVSHGWPGPPNRSIYYDMAENRFILGYTEVQLHCAAKCPADEESLTSTAANLPTEVCPVCFCDRHLAPLSRLEPIKGTMIHLCVHHLLKPAQDYGASDEVVLCCCCNEGVFVWELFSHLQRAGFNTWRRESKSRGDSTDTLDGLRDAGPHYAGELKVWMEWAKGARKAKEQASASTAAASPESPPVTLSRADDSRNALKRGKEKRCNLAHVTNITAAGSESTSKKARTSTAPTQLDNGANNMEGLWAAAIDVNESGTDLRERPMHSTV